MELEFHQLDRRYEGLRASPPERDKRVLASVARIGQQIPVVVVAAGSDDGSHILIDGYKRVRALELLRQDTVQATCWALSESEALILGRLMRTAEGDSVFEQAWLLRELQDRFGLSRDELAQRFDRTKSWVSRRLGLLTGLPDSIQDHVRRGDITAHAAMKYLLPLARANREGATKLAEAIGSLRPSTRQTEALCVAFARGDEKTRLLLLKRPEAFLRAREDDTGPQALPHSPASLLCKDLRALGGIANRAHARLLDGAARGLLEPEKQDLEQHIARTRAEIERLFDRAKEEITNAG